MGRSETGRALGALSARRWAERGKRRDARPTGRDRAAGERSRPGAEKVGRGEGRRRAAVGLVFLPISILFSLSFLSLIQTNLTQMNPNLNLNSLKHSNKLNNAPA